VKFRENKILLFQRENAVENSLFHKILRKEGLNFVKVRLPQKGPKFREKYRVEANSKLLLYHCPT
jgi:hypothetical protein